MTQRFFKDRLLAYRKNDVCIAVSLDFDLFAEGKSIPQALERLTDATYGYLNMCCMENESDEDIYRKAPKKYHDMYDLFVELDMKKKKKEEEKKQEHSLRKKEIQTSQITYSSAHLSHA